MDTFLRIDAGELLMFEGVKYQGRIKDDYFDGWGQLDTLDNIVM